LDRTTSIDLPDLGDSSGSVVSPEQERELGEGFLRELHQHSEVIDDPEIEDYIESIGQKLAANTRDYQGQFTFFMVDNHVLNAFAVPGGFVGVHSGLLLNTRNESELAAVLAHEVSHVTQHHGARAMEAQGQMTVPSIAAMMAAILVAAMVPGAGQAAIAAVSAAGIQYQINFTRANEYEADRIGIQVLADSGFDPLAMPTFFEQLATVNRFNDSASVPEYLRTHPVTTARIAESRARAEKYPPRRHQDSLGYILTWTKLKVGSIQDPRQAAQYFKRALRDGDYRSEDSARYGYALALTAAGGYEEARIQIAHLLKGDRGTPAYLLAAGRLELAARNRDKGLRYLAEAYRLYPDDRAVLLSYAEGLIAVDRARDVRALLKDFVYTHRPDLRYYKVLAEAEGRDGSLAEARLLLSEYYLRSGDMKQAIAQLKLAATQKDLDVYQRQRVESRREELQRVMDEHERNKKFFKF
jgi:predicted Zn-dependent protease